MANEAAVKEKKPAAPRKSPKAVVADRGIRGAMALMVQEIFIIGLKNNFKGTVLENKNGAGETLEATRQSSMVNQLSKEGGIIDKMDEKSEGYKKLYAAAKAAQADVVADEQNYSKAVKDFINLCTTFKAPKESRVSALKAITFK